MRPALFLDRDGVINVDTGYVHHKSEFQFVDGIFDLCRYAKERGFLLFVVTNQAGIGRGFYTEEEFRILTDWMCAVFKEEGCGLDKVYYCPSHPEHGVGRYRVDSGRRKPSPGMILEAACEFEVDLARSVLVGDNLTDVEAGNSAGVGCIFLLRHVSQSPVCVANATVVHDLPSIKRVLMSEMEGMQTTARQGELSS